MARYQTFKMFYVSKGMIHSLKDRTNRELPILPAVSSVQALLGHVWQAITRARRLEPQDSTFFIQSMDRRRRLVPPLPPSSFGNFVLSVSSITTAGELESNDMSYLAELLQRAIRSHGDTFVRALIDEWKKQTPVPLDSLKPIKNLLVLGSCSQFKMYETDFGWGNQSHQRSGCANKLEGMTAAYSGRREMEVWIW